MSLTVGSSLTGPGRGGGKNLTCGVCQEIYRSPRLLPCFHSFCLYCVEGLARTHGQSFPCPQCRKTIAVPPEGALGFQMNFYITEDELERERKGPGTAMCATHPMEPLVFFCVQCDLAICIRCKLTKHCDHGQTEDLSEAAARCAEYLEGSKERLDSTINRLCKKSALAHDSLRAAREKGTALKQQAQVQRDLLFQKIDMVLAMVVGKITTSNTAVEDRLALEAQSIQQELDCLMQLRQSVHHALTVQAPDAEKVAMEKEMRQGKGSEASLHSIEQSIPVTTFRPGLHYDSGCISEDDIHHVLGDPVTLSMPFKASGEIIVPVFQYTKTADTELSREVYGVCQIDSETIVILIWNPSANQTIRIRIDEKGKPQRKRDTKAGRVSHKRYTEHKSVRSSFKFFSEEKKAVRLNSKGYRTLMFQVHHIPEEMKISVFRIEVQPRDSGGVNTIKYHAQDTNPAEPAAFDATDTGEVFALVEIPRSQQSLIAGKTQRQVCLYRYKQSKPFATYTPPDRNFYPSDVCFWQENNQDKLLVADRQNDSVHVLSIQEDEVRFERYLAAGDRQLVRPTALNVDDKGRVWIGCENGTVLRCETQNLEPQPADDESDTDDDSNASVVSSVSAESVEENSACPLMLMVENSSRSTDSRSQMSEET